MMNPIRCTSCGRRVAWTAGESPLRSSISCSQWCAQELESTPTEERTDQWAALHLAGGLSPLNVGRIYGVAHSQVYKALDRANARRK